MDQVSLGVTAAVSTYRTTRALTVSYLAMVFFLIQPQVLQIPLTEATRHLRFVIASECTDASGVYMSFEHRLCMPPCGPHGDT